MMVYTKKPDYGPYGFRQEYFFMFFTTKAYVKHVTPGWGHFWLQGHNLHAQIQKVLPEGVQI